MADRDFYSGWASPPNGGTQYRLHLAITVVGQDIAANTSTVEWVMLLEKNRSGQGFYEYSASWSTSINGSTVAAGSGPNPNAPWAGWSSHVLTSGRATVTHDNDGTKTIAVGGTYDGANVGWAIDVVSISDNMTLPPIARATVPTVAPSPAAIGTSVMISLPRASGSYTHDLTWVSGGLSGTIDTAVGTEATWTVPDVMGEFPGLTLAPIVITVVTKLSGVVIGSRQATLFAKEPPAAPVITVHDPDTQFDVRARLVTYESSEWRPRYQLPADTLTLVDPSSATATCAIGLSKLNASDFPDYSIVDIDVFDGNNWLYTNHRFVLSRVEGDDVSPSRFNNYSGTEFVDYELGFAYIQEDYYWDGSTNHAAPTTPGEMMRYAIAQAKARGWGPRIDIAFTGSATSLGEPWINTAVNRNFSKGTPLSQMLAGLVEDGLVEYRVEYHSDKAWLVLLNPGTGSDYAADGASPSINFALADLKRAPRRGTSEKRLTRITVAGDDAVQITREKAAFDPDVFGQMEGWVSASGITTPDQAGLIGDNALRDNSSPVNERTFEYSAETAEPSFYPYVSFRPSDWVLIPSDNGPVRDRVSQVTMNKTADADLSLTVLTGDRILSGTASLAKRQAAQTGGSISGGNQSTPSPLDSRIPNAPVITTSGSTGYWNTDGAARSSVSLTWSEIMEALNGAPITVNLYEVYWRPAVGGEWALRTATDQLSIEMSDWDVLADVEFRVRGRSVAGIYGEFSEDEPVTTLAPAVDLGGPDIADIYTNGVGDIYVVWAGTLDASPAPARLAYVVAEVSIDGGATYTTEGTPIAGPGTIVLNKNGFWGDYLVRLRGYDRLGNAGDASAPETITLTDPHIDPPTPVAPTDLAATAGAAWDATGFNPVAWFDLEWTAPTLDTLGDPIGIVGYDLWGKRTGESELRYLTSSNLPSVRYVVGDGEEWSFQVSASSGFGGVSALSDPVIAVADAAIAVADAPSAPVLSQYAGLLRIQWDGGGMLPQIRYVYAMISVDSAGPYTRAGMPLNGAGEIVVPGLATGVEYFAKIVMVDERDQISTSVASDGIVLDPITGVTVQTSPVANTGIKMTSGSLTAYDGSGNPTFILDATTGEVWIAPYDAVFSFGADGVEAETGNPTVGLAVGAEDAPFNTFIHPAGFQIRNDQTPLAWLEGDASDGGLVNFVSPRARIDQRLRVGDYEFLRESKTTGTRLVIRYKGA